MAPHAGPFFIAVRSAAAGDDRPAAIANHDLPGAALAARPSIVPMAVTMAIVPMAIVPMAKVPMAPAAVAIDVTANAHATRTHAHTHVRLSQLDGRIGGGRSRQSRNPQH